MTKTPDYHDFTNIDTPRKELDRLYVGELWINAATCGECGDYIRSKNKHDFVKCFCGNVAVDGGSHYAKRNYKTKNFTNKIVLFNDSGSEAGDE